MYLGISLIERNHISLKSYFSQIIFLSNHISLIKISQITFLSLRDFYFVISPNISLISYFSH